MELSPSVNEILPDDITKLDHTLIPPKCQGDARRIRLVQSCLSAIIDRLGEMSTAEQGLNKVITTAEKLRNLHDIIYLLKEPTAQSGKGEVIAILKIGRKHLFLFDERTVHMREVEPMCVLDFFVLREYQRHGHGRRLFDHMLEDMATSAHLLAVDGPSPKMEQFLLKNYGLERLIRQNNNFAVSSQFFQKNTTEIRAGAAGCSASPPAPQLERIIARQPRSTIAKVIHGSTLSPTPSTNSYTPTNMSFNRSY